MTDKEFKRLNRSQLIDIIYQLQLKQEELVAENNQLRDQLADKRLRMRQVGNIAEAALEINHVMEAAQSAAEQYIEEILQLRKETETVCRRMLEEARKKADAMVGDARQKDSAVDAILREYRKRPTGRR
jgi:cell division septum initiation protein DivIVA